MVCVFLTMNDGEIIHTACQGYAWNNNNNRYSLVQWCRHSHRRMTDLIAFLSLSGVSILLTVTDFMDISSGIPLGQLSLLGSMRSLKQMAPQKQGCQ